jgi:hypothetical protein
MTSPRNFEGQHQICASIHASDNIRTCSIDLQTTPIVWPIYPGRTDSRKATLRLPPPTVNLVSLQTTSEDVLSTPRSAPRPHAQHTTHPLDAITSLSIPLRATHTLRRPRSVIQDYQRSHGQLHHGSTNAHCHSVRCREPASNPSDQYGEHSGGRWGIGDQFVQQALGCVDWTGDLCFAGKLFLISMLLGSCRGALKV